MVPADAAENIEIIRRRNDLFVTRLSNAAANNGDARRAGEEEARRDDAMPQFDICYRDEHGSLAAKVTTPAPDAHRAKILAHALKEREHKTLEVWEGETLVYERGH